MENVCKRTVYLLIFKAKIQYPVNLQDETNYLSITTATQCLQALLPSISGFSAPDSFAVSIKLHLNALKFEHSGKRGQPSLMGLANQGTIRQEQPSSGKNRLKGRTFSPSRSLSLFSFLPNLIVTEVSLSTSFSFIHSFFHGFYTTRRYKMAQVQENRFSQL